MIALALRAAWLLRSRAASGKRLHPLQYRHLNLLQRWGVVYRDLLSERERGLPRVSEFERSCLPGDSVQYTELPQTKGAGTSCAICVRAAYLNRRGEWEPAKFVDASLEPSGFSKRFGR